MIKYCFILNMDYDQPVSGVHLVLDVLKLFKTDEVLVIKKGTIENLKPNESNTINIRPKHVSKSNLIGRYFAELNYYKRVGKVLKMNGVSPSVYFLQSSPLAYFIAKHIKKKYNARIVYNAQDLFPDNIIGKSKLKKLLFLPFSILDKKLYKKVDHIITISDNIKESIHHKKIPNSKISVVHNWAKESSLTEDFDFKTKYNLQSKFVVLYAGNIGKFQNVKMILDAAKITSNENIVYAIQGDGIKRLELEEYSKQLGLKNVKFIPQAPIDTMQETYRAVNINLITLNKEIYKTALPSKLAFCLNTSVPLIITMEDKASIRKILENDPITKFVLPDDFVSLRDCVVELYNNYSGDSYNDNRSKIMDEYFNKNKNAVKYHDIIVSKE